MPIDPRRIFSPLMEFIMSGFALLPLILFVLPALAWGAVHAAVEAGERTRRRAAPRRHGFRPVLIAGGKADAPAMKRAAP